MSGNISASQNVFLYKYLGKLWFATMAIVLLISKVMSSITCNNKDKSFSHAPLNSSITLFT